MTVTIYLPTNTVAEEAIQVDIQSKKIITFSQSANPELYSYNRMPYFMPWFDEQSDLICKFNTFSEHYKSKKNEIESTFARLMRIDEIVT